jgi:hypothetical protein
MRLTGVCAFVALVAAGPVSLEGWAGRGPEKSSPVVVKGGRLTFDPKTCGEGEGSIAWGLGSAGVRVLGREGDVCVFDYRWEVEGAGNYQAHRVRVPVNSGPVVIDHGVKNGGKEHFWSAIYTSFTAEQAGPARRYFRGWFEVPLGKEFVKFQEWRPGDTARPALRGDKVTLRALVYLDDKFTNLAGTKWRRQSVVTRLGEGKEWGWAQAVAEGMTPYEVRRALVPVKIAGPARDWLPGYQDDGSTAYVELQLIAVERK